jgi:hypothetical protein
MYEVWAAQIYKEGSTKLASILRRAARESVLSVRRYQRPDGSLFVVKNLAPSNRRVGFEIYSFSSCLDLLTASMLGIAQAFAEESIDIGEFLPLQVSTAFEIKELHKVRQAQ